MKNRGGGGGGDGSGGGLVKELAKGRVVVVSSGKGSNGNGLPCPCVGVVLLDAAATRAASQAASPSSLSSAAAVVAAPPAPPAKQSMASARAALIASNSSTLAASAASGGSGSMMMTIQKRIVDGGEVDMESAMVWVLVQLPPAANAADNNNQATSSLVSWDEKQPVPVNMAYEEGVYYSILQVKVKDQLASVYQEKLTAAYTATVSQVATALSVYTATMAVDEVKLLDFHKQLKINDLDFADRQARLTSLHREWLTLHQTLQAEQQPVAALLPTLYSSAWLLKRTAKKLALLERAISDENLSLFPDFRQRIGVLGLLGYLDKDCQVITKKGRVACELNACDELLGTELLFHNVLEPLNPPEAAAMLSALVFQEKNEVEEPLTSRMEVAKMQMMTIHSQLLQLQELQGIEIDADAKPIVNFGLCTVVYQWARGIAFKDITRMTEFQEGSIVRAITRLDELCRDIQKAAKVMGNPSLYHKMEAASQCIKRDIVFAASLYIT